MPERDHIEERRHTMRQVGRLRKQAPDVMGGFASLYKAANAERTLDKKQTELIALAISVAIRCDPCTAAHIEDALKAGASRDEILDAMGIAIMMGGAPVAMYSAEAVEMLEQFEAQHTTS
jgi:AhpD family alkylhydroperoxidase